MTSAINPNNIDGSYPVAGQDNNSQGFRDNFTNIKVNFQDAADEITDLQNKGVFKAALTGTSLDNNMGNVLLYNTRIQGFSATKLSPTGTSGAISVIYGAGHYQSIATSGSINVSFSGWASNGTYGYLKLQFNITDPLHTVQFTGATTYLGTAGIQGYNTITNTITFTASGIYEFGFGSYDNGTTITIFDLNRGLTNFSGADITLDDVTATGNIVANTVAKTAWFRTVQVANNVVSTGNVTGGNLTTAGVVSATANIVGGNITTAGLVSATGNVTGGNVNSFIRPTAGSPSQAPILLASGTNLSTAAAGAIEFDGVVLYGTPQAQQRGVLPAEHFIALTSTYVANDSSSAQKVFNSPTNGTVTLPGSTSYFIEGMYVITRTLGSTAHQLNTLFAVSQPLTSIQYMAEATSSTGAPTPSTGASTTVYGTTVSALQVTPASTSGSEHITVWIRGVIRTNSATTFTPQIQYTSAPGGSPSILANSYFRLTPIGTNSVASVGNWS